MTMDARIEIVGGRELRRAMQDPEFVRGPATEFIRSVAFEIQGRAQQNAPSNVGRLRNSITVQMGIKRHIHGQGTVFAQEPGSVSATVGSNLVYAKPVEYGRRPGKRPPPEAMRFWVRRRLGIRGPAINSVAFLVGRKIGRFGTKPQPYLGPALEGARGFIERALQNLGREIERRWSR